MRDESEVRSKDRRCRRDSSSKQVDGMAEEESVRELWRGGTAELSRSQMQERHSSRRLWRQEGRRKSRLDVEQRE
jgi:hypothetical protein